MRGWVQMHGLIRIIHRILHVRQDRGRDSLRLEAFPVKAAEPLVLADVADAAFLVAQALRGLLSAEGLDQHLCLAGDAVAELDRVDPAQDVLMGSGSRAIQFFYEFFPIHNFVKNSQPPTPVNGQVVLGPEGSLPGD